MSKLWGIARRVAVCVVLALGALAGSAGVSHAQAPQATTEANGFVGIAIRLSAHTVGAPARLVVERVLPDGPAKAAGVERGDEIIAVDGHSLKGKTLRDITHMIRGAVGTKVTLTLSRHGQKREVTITRAKAPHWHGSPAPSPH